MSKRATMQQRSKFSSKRMASSLLKVSPTYTTPLKSWLSLLTGSNTTSSQRSQKNVSIWHAKTCRTPSRDLRIITETALTSVNWSNSWLNIPSRQLNMWCISLTRQSSSSTELTALAITHWYLWFGEEVGPGASRFGHTSTICFTPTDMSCTANDRLNE